MTNALAKSCRVLCLLMKLPILKIRKNTIPIFKVSLGNRVFLRNSQIGDYVYIGDDCVINYATIGNYSCIADGVQIGGMEHPYWDHSISPKLSDQYIFGKETKIGYDVWIAAGCIIKQGVTIGNGAVIGANSYVTKDVPPYAVVFGTPAKIFKYRFNEEVIDKIDKSEYWQNPPQIAKKILNELKNDR